MHLFNVSGEHYDAGVGLFGGSGALTDAQVDALYNAGAGVSASAAIAATSPLYYFPMSEKTGPMVDLVGGVELARTGAPGVIGGNITDLAVPNAPCVSALDLSGNIAAGDSFKNATIADQPILKASQFGALPGFDFDGTSQHWITSSLSVASGDKTIIAVLHNDVGTPAGTAYVVLDSETTRLAALIHSATGKWGYYNTDYRDSTKDAAVEDSVISWVLATSNNGAMYDGLTQIGSGMNFTAQAISGDCTIGSITTAGLYWNGRLGMIAVYDSALDDSVRIPLVSGLMRRWGIA